MTPRPIEPMVVFSDRVRRIVARVLLVGLSALAFLYMFGCESTDEPADPCKGYVVQADTVVYPSGDTLIFRGCNGTTWAHE